MGLVPVSQHPFIKGIVAGNQPLAQPKGAIQRGSNLVYTSRGALDVADGSQIINAFNGAIQTGRGKAMADFLFKPTGVTSYYLRLAKALDIPLGAPQNLVTADGGAGGSLPTGVTISYLVTAIDGAGGETGPSAIATFVEGGAAHKVILTWNVVPNAAGYNIYSNLGSGTSFLLIGTGLPVPQVPAGTLTATYTDDGSAVTSQSFASAKVQVTSQQTGGPLSTTVAFTLVSPNTIIRVGLGISLAGSSNAAFNIGWTITGITSSTTFVATAAGTISTVGTISTGGTITTNVTHAPIGGDNTQQTALFQMPPIVGNPAALPVSYNNSNIVALFPADKPFVDGGGGGGPGGGGGTGGGGSAGGPGGGSTQTPSGGIPGNVTIIPQFKQFSNRAVIALGNGFPMQLFSDTGTLVNPATIAAISAISVDAFGVVTVTTSVPHGLSAAQVGANVVIAGVTDATYNGVFVTIQIVSTTQYKVRNLAAIGHAASSGGTSTTTAIPIISTYTPAFPKWTASTPFVVGDIIVPATQPSPAIYLTCFQAGNTGTVEPTWPSGAPISSQITEVGAPAGTPGVIWTVTALLNSTAPPPPGAAHIEIYANILWAFNTSPTNTSNGLDGPTALRASAVGNPNSWNPVNQAFIDKDDGTEGMGLAKFTITALGIPPEGTLIAFKNYSPYQILGVFGSANFAIQPVSSNMGCTAPRTINFVPGFGIMRMTHLGIATFNGVKDELISEQIRPYLFPMNDSTFQDITVVDANNVSLSWAAQTANPPMYCVLTPIGNSNAQLTRIFCYDLVFKAWGIVDLPFAASFIGQFQTNVANPVTTLGGFSDGCLSRWQAGDIQWDTSGSGARSPSNVTWSFRTNRVASQEVDQRIYCRRLIVSGNNSGAAGTVTCTAYGSGKVLQVLTFRIPANAEWSVDMPIGFSDRDFDVVVSSSIHGDVHGCTYEIEPRPMGVVIGSGI